MITPLPGWADFDGDGYGGLVVRDVGQVSGDSQDRPGELRVFRGSDSGPGSRAHRITMKTLGLPGIDERSWGRRVRRCPRGSRRQRRPATRTSRWSSRRAHRPGLGHGRCRHASWERRASPTPARSQGMRLWVVAAGSLLLVVRFRPRMPEALRLGNRDGPRGNGLRGPRMRVHCCGGLLVTADQASAPRCAPAVSAEVVTLAMAWSIRATNTSRHEARSRASNRHRWVMGWRERAARIWSAL